MAGRAAVLSGWTPKAGSAKPQNGQRRSAAEATAFHVSGLSTTVSLLRSTLAHLGTLCQADFGECIRVTRPPCRAHRRSPTTAVLGDGQIRRAPRPITLACKAIVTLLSAQSQLEASAIAQTGWPRRTDPQAQGNLAGPRERKIMDRSTTTLSCLTRAAAHSAASHSFPFEASATNSLGCPQHSDMATLHSSPADAPWGLK